MTRALGPLESDVLGALWSRGGPATVRDLLPAFPALAYTTLMTTLDRLRRKGVVEREAVGRAFAYRARWTRGEWIARTASHGIADLLPETGSARPLLSMFVEAVGARDAAMLDELESLVRDARRRRAVESKGRSRG